MCSFICRNRLKINQTISSFYRNENCLFLRKRILRMPSSIPNVTAKHKD